MQLWQTVFVLMYGLLALWGVVLSVHKCRNRRKSYELTPLIFILLGGFIWADMVVFGIFWLLASVLSLVLQDFILFLLIVSLFWLVRSFGETMYWFFQQFTPRKGNEPEKFWFHSIVRDDSVWIVMQIMWQCITVITVITSLYLGRLWLK